MPGDIIVLARRWLDLSRSESELRLEILRCRRSSDHALHKALVIAWERAREKRVGAEAKLRALAGELGEVHAPP